ncbi:MAG: PAS domain S-box protein [Pseudomonadota bacterium]
MSINREIRSPFSTFDASIKHMAWAMIESMPDSLIVTALNGEIIYLNNAAEQLLALTFSQAFSRRIDSVLHLEPVPDQKNAVDDWNQVAGERVVPVSGRQLQGRWLLDRDGKVTPVDIRVSMVRHDPNSDANLLLSIRSTPETAANPDDQIARRQPRVLDYKGFHRRIREAFDDSRRNDREHGLLFLTLESGSGGQASPGAGTDENDHIEIASAIRAAVGPHESVCRLGTQKYGVLLDGYSLLNSIRSATAIMGSLYGDKPVRDCDPATMKIWIGVAPINKFSPGIPANLIGMALVASCEAKLSGESLAVRVYRPGVKVAFTEPESFRQEVTLGADS